MKKYLIFGAIAMLAMALIVVSLIQLSSAGKDGPDAQFEYPIIWQQAREPNSSQEMGRLELYKDGTARLVDIRLGTIGHDEARRSCVLNDDTPFTGRARWEIDADGALQVLNDEGRSVFLPESARFSGPDWSELSENLCDRESIRFSPVLEE